MRTPDRGKPGDCVVRFIGAFLAEPTDVPSNAVAYVAAPDLRRGLPGGLRHACGDGLGARRRGFGGSMATATSLTKPSHSAWLYTRAWLNLQQPSMLFDLAAARLVERQVLVPGVSILARLMVRIRERANARLYRSWLACPPQNSPINSKSC
jgi:hypothetical protein